MAMPPDKEQTPDELEAGVQGFNKPKDQAAGGDEMAEAGGDPVKLAQDVGDGLAKLGELLNASQDASDDDKQSMAQILSMYTDLVQNSLGKAPGESQMQKADPGAKPMEAGMTGVPIDGPQSRQ